MVTGEVGVLFCLKWLGRYHRGVRKNWRCQPSFGLSGVDMTIEVNFTFHDERNSGIDDIKKPSPASYTPPSSEYGWCSWTRKGRVTALCNSFWENGSSTKPCGIPKEKLEWMVFRVLIPTEEVPPGNVCYLGNENAQMFRISRALGGLGAGHSTVWYVNVNDNCAKY